MAGNVLPVEPELTASVIVAAIRKYYSLLANDTILWHFMAGQLKVKVEIWFEGSVFIGNRRKTNEWSHLWMFTIDVVSLRDEECWTVLSRPNKETSLIADNVLLFRCSDLIKKYNFVKQWKLLSFRIKNKIMKLIIQVVSMLGT